MLYDVAFMLKPKKDDKTGEKHLTTVQVTSTDEKNALVQAVLKASGTLKGEEVERIEALIRPFSR